MNEKQESDEMERAQANLQKYAELILEDLNDQKSGWYYQFSAAVEKVRNLKGEWTAQG